MSLELHVIRHAIAEERSPGADDASRALTEQGRTRFEREVAGLARLGVVLDRIEHSPWLRAAQTARLLEPLLAEGGRLRPSEWLARPPGRELLESLGTGRVAVVGHEPWLSELVGLLTTGDVGDGAAFEMKKGSVASLRGEPRPGGACLLALLPPKLLRLLG